MTALDEDCNDLGRIFAFKKSSCVLEFGIGSLRVLFQKFIQAPPRALFELFAYAAGARNFAPLGFDVGIVEHPASAACAGNWCEKNATTFVSRATGTATSVGVDRSILRDAHVDDGCNIGDIQPAGCDVSGDQAGDRAFAEGVECARPLALY